MKQPKIIFKGDGIRKVELKRNEDIKETGTYYRELCEKLCISVKTAQEGNKTIMDMEKLNRTLNNGSPKLEDIYWVTVDECYLCDEVTEGQDTSKNAIIISEPVDEEELVCILYETGSIDFVPQDILTLKDSEL